MLQNSNETRVGISDYKISYAPNKIMTVGLGSCIGTIIYDPATKIGGLSHIMLPDSTPFEQNGRELNLAKYANTALPLMVEQLRKKAPRAHFKAKISGGANMFGFKNNLTTASIGQRNAQAVLEQLEKLKIPVVGQDTGGNRGRTMVVDLSNFQTLIKAVREEDRYI
ncbi:sequence specific deamidase required for methylation of methyl-accepting chemotaxis proteins (MCPs) by CheR [Ligilactobacillus salitolerans]|uniref:Probable chemoreceptor glutamine deamidase CheD n=1 Tax=Ligilactobacillus salitolerans TaxID=1808352 RepID=A0A401ITP4_9LACO|nr:chemotaxis protein CheD [Ligilactobacillus salitolerans]GBG94911.1 sequence specific deamidase required for methylation of methyl-accepting chemotaxis proteins (MCPs) by CheR [Ligilactobacillus salitolerans]